MILNKYTHISLGTLVIIVDCTITLSTVVAFGDWRLPMYSWIIVFIEGKLSIWLLTELLFIRR